MYQPAQMIDTHQHLWIPSERRYAWLEQAGPPLEADFGPEDVEADVAAAGITGTVLVQAEDSYEDTCYMVSVAKTTPTVIGVVAWAPLDRVAEATVALDLYAHAPVIRGIRVLNHNYDDPRWLLRPEVTYLLRCFPTADIWNFGPLTNFCQSLWSVDPNTVGDPVLLYNFTLGFRNSILWAAGLALLAITFMLVLLFRSLKMAMLALIPLLVGTGLTINLMWLLNLPFNQANVLFVPLSLREGIEFGIIILARWRQEESARAITLPASTATG